MMWRKCAFALAGGTWIAIMVAILLLIVAIQSFLRYQSAIYSFSGTGFIMSDPLIGYTGMPNAEMHHLTPPVYDVYTNDRGGRDSYRGRPAPKKVDFLFLGNSYVWGGGVSDEETFAKTVARRLGVSVFNAAQPNYSMLAALLTIDKFADMRPQYIVFGYMAELLSTNFSPCGHITAVFCRPMAYLDRRPTGLEMQPPGDAQVYSDYVHDILFHHAFGWQDIYWTAYQDIFLTISNRTRVQNLPRQSRTEANSDWKSDAVWNALGLRLLVDEMAKKASSLGATLIFVNIGDPSYSPPHEVVEAIEDGQSSGRFLYVDCAPLLQQAADARGMDHIRFPQDGHFTAAAHRIVADAIASLVSHEALPQETR